MKLNFLKKYNLFPVYLIYKLLLLFGGMATLCKILTNVPLDINSQSTKQKLKQTINILSFYFYLSKKIRLDVSSESSA